jgi:MOSC domain-containing protein YiiM
MGEKGWAKRFTADARPGTYLRVLRPGTIQAGDPISVLHRPDHEVTVSLYFRAELTERELLPQLLAAGDDLPAGTRKDVERYLARASRRE